MEKMPDEPTVTISVPSAAQGQGLATQSRGPPATLQDPERFPQNLVLSGLEGWGKGQTVENRIQEPENSTQRRRPALP